MITGGLGKGVGGGEESCYVQERWQAPRRLSQSRISNGGNSPEEYEYGIPKLMDNQTGYGEQSEEQRKSPEGEPGISGRVAGRRGACAALGG